MQKYNETFENLFWAHYPRKAGKPAAERVWLNIIKREPAAALAILEGIDRHKTSEQWQDPRYIPHPATFLRQRRWEDLVAENVENEWLVDWTLILRMIREKGSYWTPPGPWSDRGRRALQAIGGYAKLCQSPEASLPAIRKKFAKIYATI